MGSHKIEILWAGQKQLDDLFIACTKIEEDTEEADQ